MEDLPGARDSLTSLADHFLWTLQVYIQVILFAKIRVIRTQFRHTFLDIIDCFAFAICMRIAVERVCVLDLIITRSSNSRSIPRPPSIVVLKIGVVSCLTKPHPRPNRLLHARKLAIRILWKIKTTFRLLRVVPTRLPVCIYTTEGPTYGHAHKQTHSPHRYLPCFSASNPNPSTHISERTTVSRKPSDRRLNIRMPRLAPRSYSPESKHSRFADLSEQMSE
ncbi:hypothetical protein TBK1r_01830 [Stieleria magnilauensis]|uniref:Uncharacterized protein n=1 Tax=Stieleria magnilauensis TaxID=2527963 RepID=A0ABX5XH07_9BACT|nr:hypothetical protein TBK1r_01830 [Planctomycetes bacterium TBK1r]